MPTTHGGGIPASDVVPDKPALRVPTAEGMRELCDRTEVMDLCMGVLDAALGAEFDLTATIENGATCVAHGRR